MLSVTITFTPVDEGTPTKEMNLLLLMSNGQTCQGFMDGGVWYDASAWPIKRADAATVVAWAEMPRINV